MTHTDQTRRTTLAGLVVLTAALPGIAEASVDPIFTVIERHRELSVHLDAAVSVSGKLLDGPEFDAAEAVAEQCSQTLIEHADVLIRSKPTTIAGIVALSRYVGTLGEWQLPDDQGWHQTLLGTMADALDGMA